MVPCGIRKETLTQPSPDEIDRLVRQRLRSLRTALGMSLDELAARTNLSASTISRVETGRRTLGLDVLLPLAGALQIDLDALLSRPDDGDVVIRPVPSGPPERTTWVLSRPTATTAAIKVRLDPAAVEPPQRVHVGHDWFFVLEGRVLLLLGERRITVEAGQAAEFDTMTPHSFTAVDGPAEVIMLFDRDGQRAHAHGEGGAHSPARP